MSARPFQRRGPSGPLAAKLLGIIQRGYDQTEKSQPLGTTSTFLATIPKNAALDPLQVVLPGVVPGNVLEVDLSVYIRNQNAGVELFSVAAAVSFVDAPVFPADFALINSSVANVFAAINTATIYRSLTAVAIPPGATKATVRVAYDDGTIGNFFVDGSDGFPSVSGSTLTASEIAQDTITQPIPFTLVPYP
jgi:hypothetical protein